MGKPRGRCFHSFQVRGPPRWAEAGGRAAAPEPISAPAPLSSEMRERTRTTARRRPEPDEAPLESAPTPQPEHREERLPDPGPRDLSLRDWGAVTVRAGKEMLDDNMMMIAQALAYSSFLAIPSILLVVIGLFTLLAGPSTIDTVINHLGHVMPHQAKTLLGQSLHRLDHQQSATVVMAIVGFVLAQWSILIVGLLAAFATLLYLGPDVDHPRWRLLTVGSGVATLIWLGISGAFAFYTGHFGSYNKTWGSLAAVIIMLMWLWLSALALLFGAELNAEAERSRELRRGEPAEQDIQAPSRA